jgi:hypothetical protein
LFAAQDSVQWVEAGKALLWQGRDGWGVTTLSTGHVRPIPVADPYGAMAGISADERTIAVLGDTDAGRRITVVAVDGSLLLHVTIPNGWQFHDANVYLP